MVPTSQLGISNYKWWMEIWKCWDSLQPSTFTGIPLPSSAVRRKYELFPSPLWLQHVQSVNTPQSSQSPPLYLTRVKNLSWNSRQLLISDIWNPGCSTCSRSDERNVRSCLPLVFINNSALAQLKCLPICHLVSEKMTSHLPRTEPLQSSHQVTGEWGGSELW